MAADPTYELRRFTVEEYELMGGTGVLGDDRTELLDGEIVVMSPIGPFHAGIVDIIAEALFAQALGRVAIRVQNPMRLLPRSEPQPDIVVARRRQDSYVSAHPTAEDTLLLIEVADSSLPADRAVKLPIYAHQRIVEVWIIDLAGRRVFVHTDPADGAYRCVRTLAPGDVLVPTAIDDVAIPVDQIFR